MSQLRLAFISLIRPIRASELGGFFGTSFSVTKVSSSLLGFIDACLWTFIFRPGFVFKCQYLEQFQPQGLSIWGKYKGYIGLPTGYSDSS